MFYCQLSFVNATDLILIRHFFIFSPNSFIYLFFAGWAQNEIFETGDS